LKKSMSDNMQTKDCPSCGKVAVEVISYARSDKPEGVRVGWYCSFCRNWDPAIGREKKVEPNG